MSIHILIVEDQKSHAEMLGEVITRATPVFRVRYASCGAEARAALSDGPVDCVLMDYDLPDESGFECAAALRAENPDLPMIIVTGKGDETLVVEAWKRQRATDYVSKVGHYTPRVLAALHDTLTKTVFRRADSGWLLGYAGQERVLRDLAGLRYLHTLIEHEGKPVTVRALTASELPPAEGDRSSVETAAGVSIVAEPEATGSLLDSRARGEFKGRLFALHEERQQAKERRDAQRETEVDAEVSAIQRQLRASGYRAVTPSRENLRVRVTRALERADEEVRTAFPSLHRRLGRVSTGYHCTYAPDPDWPLYWTLY